MIDVNDVKYIVHSTLTTTTVIKLVVVVPRHQPAHDTTRIFGGTDCGGEGRGLVRGGETDRGDAGGIMVFVGVVVLSRLCRSAEIMLLGEGRRRFGREK